MPAKPPLTRSTLDASGCDMPDCGHDHSVLFLTQTCHMRAGVIAKYVKATGTLELSCAECERPVVNVLVAAGPT